MPAPTCSTAAAAPTLLVGLGGDDIYFVDNAGDRWSRRPAAGTDMRLRQRQLRARGRAGGRAAARPTSNGGTAAINLTGNELANTIYGNAGANMPERRRRRATC